MTSQVRLFPAALAAAIVVFGFGYVTVGRAGATDAAAATGSTAVDVQAASRMAEVAEVKAIAPRTRLPLSVASQS